LLAAGLSWIQGISPIERLVQLNSRLYRKLHPLPFDLHELDPRSRREVPEHIFAEGQALAAGSA